MHVTLGVIWDQVLQNVQLVSLPPIHRVTQLFILYRVYRIPELFYKGYFAMHKMCCPLLPLCTWFGDILNFTVIGRRC